MFCKHDYKVLSDKVIVSKGSKYQETYYGSYGVKVSKKPVPYYKERHSVILKCIKCGKIKNINK